MVFVPWRGRSSLKKFQFDCPRWCNGSTEDCDSFSLGSNPGLGPLGSSNSDSQTKRFIYSECHLKDGMTPKTVFVLRCLYDSGAHYCHLNVIAVD